MMPSLRMFCSCCWLDSYTFERSGKLAGGTRIRNFAPLFALVLVLSSCYAQTKSVTQEQPVFRPPTALKLHADNEHYYEEKFDRIPYVADNVVYLFAGENFGINVTITDDRISRIIYQHDPSKADVEFKFTQEKSPQGFIMLLITRNKLKRKIRFDALMTLPDKKEVYKTTVLPIDRTLSSFESWPHPIVQLVLENVRFSEEKSPTQP